MEKHTILLVEDEPHLAKVVSDSLEQKGYKVVHAADGHKAYNLFMSQAFSLCIVDVMLPGTGGFTLVRQIRAYNVLVPVLFLTARSATEDVIEGYGSGGNDYLKKPFSLEELYLRINELLKRNVHRASVSEAQCQIGRFIFDPKKQSLKNGESSVIQLSHRESALLLLLSNNRNSLLERKQTLITLWGDDNFFNTRTMDVFITKLRKHMKDDPAVQIVNIRGIGYKLIC